MDAVLVKSEMVISTGSNPSEGSNPKRGLDPIRVCNDTEVEAALGAMAMGVYR